MLCQRQQEPDQRNQKLYNPDSPLLIVDVKEGDVVKEVNEPSYIEPKQQLYLIISYNITVNFIKKIHDGWKYLIFQIKLLCPNHNFRASFGQL